MTAARVTPVLLSGGSGTRLWPLSRKMHPKQLLPLAGEESMLQATYLRVSDPAQYAAPIVIANADHRFTIAEQLRLSGATGWSLLLEPMARNTAPAVAASAIHKLRASGDGLMLVLPADHVVRDDAAFAAAVALAMPLADAGCLVTFGIHPERAETGYGYIEQGAAIDGNTGCFRVASFKEKPPLAVAEAYVKDGRHFWNSGMFLFRASTFLEELNRHAPAVFAAAEAAVAAAQSDLDFLRLDGDAFGASPDISIDYAVMERTEHAAVVPCDLGWTDVGSWAALWEIGEKDAAGNLAIGDVLTADCSDCYIRSDSRLVTGLGLKDIVIVESGDAVMVATRDKVQQVKDFVTVLRGAGRDEADKHRSAHRPWGHYEVLSVAAGWQVRKLVLRPRASIGLQVHRERSEHWILVSGEARVSIDGKQRRLLPGESLHVPVGAVHRLEALGDAPVELLEVQTGARLTEEDVVRLADDAAEAPTEPHAVRMAGLAG